MIETVLRRVVAAACALCLGATTSFAVEAAVGGAFPGEPASMSLAAVQSAAKTLRTRVAARRTAGVPSLLRGRLFVDGVESETMSPARMARWSLDFEDRATGRRITDWDAPHGKPMHLVVVSSDLGEFAHIHPVLRVDGTFEIAVNEPNGDPDSQDAASAVTRPGPYLLFAEVQPRAGAAQLASFNVLSRGTPGQSPARPDPALPSGGIRKYFTEYGRPGEEGAAYQVTLTVARMAGMIHAKFNIQRAMSHGDRAMYMDVTDLQPWLGMPGHAILIGTDGARAEQRVFAHMHAEGQSGEHRVSQAHEHDGGHGGGAGPDMSFTLSGGEVPAPGVYKLWGQFKRNDRILTFPFVISL